MAGIKPMPKASGSLTISYGLVNVGVQYAPIIEPKNGRLSGKFLDPATHLPAKQVYVNEAGEQVQKVTGYPHGDGHIVLSDGEAQALKGERSGRLELVAFVDDVDPVHIDKTHIVWPQKGHEAAYDVLCSVLETSGGVLVGTTVFESTRAIALRYAYGCLIAHVCRYDALVRHGHAQTVAEAKEARPEPDAALLDLAQQMFSSLPSEFDFAAIADDYDERLRAAVQAAAGGKPLPVVEKLGETPVSDLMEALKATVAAAAEPPKKKSRAKVKA